MATLDLCLILVCISRICSTAVRTNVFDLEQNMKDEFSLHNLLHKDREPGVAMFHSHEDCNITAFADTGHILSTLIKDDHIENITLQFVAFGNRFTVDLHLTRDLFATSYTREVLHEKGKDVKESLHRKERCYYQGQIRANPASHAALSTCDGFRGYVSDGKETYHIHPISGMQHRIFRNKDRKKFNLKCGTEKHDVYDPPSHMFAQHSRRKRSIQEPYDANKFTRYVELYLVNDYRTYDLHGRNDTVVFRRSQDIANIVNSLYRQLNIYIVLVGVEVWNMGDKITISSSADTTMENFLRYRKERINPYHVNDNAQLITGIFFDHGVVGKAIKGPICTHQFSGGVSMDYDGLVTLVATTMAHEMGHNFGMEHDSDIKCSCPEDKCIMAATSGQISPHHWSSCSQNALEEAFDLGMDYCLRNLPKTVFAGPVCGNGIMEEGEGCDCGLPEDCTNRCCNATSCELHAKAECAAGRCCDLTTCKPKKGAVLCREPKDECDLPEFCDGAQEFCPPDVYMKDGVTCSGGQSYCYKGRCHTHNAQCQLLWGNTGRVSDPICFQQLNVRGDHDGNCGYNWTTDRYHNCDRENVMCGLLHCVHLNEKLMFWRDNLALDMRANFLTRGNTQYVCRSTMLDVGLDMPDPGLVPDGAKCEENKICIKQTCTPLVKLKILECPDCNDNGVCNSNGHCHCNVGYSPPLCDRPGFGGSVDSGPASDEYDDHGLLIALLVVFLVVLPILVLAVLAFFNRRRLLAWWKLGPRVKFGAVIKKPQPTGQHPPPPRPSSSFSNKRWSAGPNKPSSSVEISGPLTENPPAYDSYLNDSSSAAAVPAAPHRPIFTPPAPKPVPVPPRIQPPAARPTPALAPAPASGMSSLGRDRKAFFRNSTQTATEAEKVPLNSAVESNHLPKLLPVSVAAERHQKEREAAAELTLKRQQKEREKALGESTLKRQQKEKGEAKADDQTTQSPPTSPTKAGRKIAHSQSMREAGARDQLGVGDKLVKRESFRGAEISSPILVSTTNRDSQVFADFELDQSGVISRPISKGHSVHGPNPSSELAQDGSRNVVRRSNSDRPLSPKKFGPTATDSLKRSGHTQGFTPRPLPPEPVIETEPILESEPLYINGGLSDLGDLKAQISSAFDSIHLSSPAPAIPAKGVTSPPTVAVSKPAGSVSRSLVSSAASNPSTTSTTGSSGIGSKPTPAFSSKPSTVPAPKPTTPFQKSSLNSKTTTPFQNNTVNNKTSAQLQNNNNKNSTPSQNPSSKTTTPSLNSSISSKAAPLERVLSNAIKTPFSSASNTGGVTPSSSSASSASKTTGGNESAKPTAGLGNKPSATTTNSGLSVRGPFGTSLSKISDSTKGSGANQSSVTSAGSRPSTGSSLANRSSTPSSHAGKGVTPSTGSKGPTTSSSTAGNAGRGPVGSAANKPSVPSKLASSSTNPSNKVASAASTIKGSTSGPTTAGSSAARKGPGVGGASTANAGRGSNLQRNVSATNRPSVAPKPGASVAPKPGVGKSVRSYNF